MAKLLTEKLNEKTNGAYSYLRVTSAEVNVRLKKIELQFLFPSERESEVQLKKDEITKEIQSILKSNAEVIVKFKKSHFDFDFFKANLFAFLNAYPSLVNTLGDQDIALIKGEANEFTVVFSLFPSVYDYCKTMRLQTEIENYIKVNYCEPIKVRLVSKNNDAIEINEFDLIDDAVKLVPEFNGGRQIRPENVEEFIGDIVYDTCMYIEDVKSGKIDVALCGSVGKILEIMRKPNPDKPDELRKKFFKFTLTDFTDTIQCIYFPNKKTVQQMGLLSQGKDVVCRGNIDVDLFKNDGSLTFKIRDISLCTLPKEFTVNRLKMQVPAVYKTIFPKPYVETKQTTLFEIQQKQSEDIPPFAIGKTFCVFDLETTGFAADNDKIIEIGAVKLVDGVVVETFETFVDPLQPLPEKIKNLTHISDEDLFGRPLIEDVMPDFYKFADGCILVGQNVRFDYSFVAAKGKPLGIFFDQETMDTIELAKKYYPQIGKYKLETLAKFFNVVNKGAHRAIFDAWATAEIFLKLIKNIT